MKLVACHSCNAILDAAKTYWHMQGCGASKRAVTYTPPNPEIAARLEGLASRRIDR